MNKIDDTHPYYLGFDAETTGVDPDKDILVEIGMTAFDRHLRPLKSWKSMVNSHRYQECLQLATPYVSNMHAHSGLWADMESAGGSDTRSKAVQAQALEWIDENGYRNLPMLGSSVAFDRSFLKVEMPQLLEAFHYRSIDAISLCLIAEHTAGVMPAKYLTPGSAPGRCTGRSMTHRPLCRPYSCMPDWLNCRNKAKHPCASP
ncbi:exonuclease domain-containing protein [Corynebacterium casei]|uniref:exonuclease domain-containing protein n=1 Tax=Corynebacterium casei TaxID=160386 RepID=UPI00186928B7|nr:exonuclease domain-containing protein [Corynebacterium casei]